MSDTSVTSVHENDWRKSTFSNASGNCVEIKPLPDGGWQVRDSKDEGRGPVLTFDLGEVDAFKKGLIAGEF
ncbi:DUF397 domain-containing protein [Nocardia sp. NPDC059246]|uniref:DUF397 domain-containing protein n=1 Tax=unclassified Nocardia TaxID=2637762 RepID=UPI0036CA685B